jgi:hypothetical protein
MFLEGVQTRGCCVTKKIVNPIVKIERKTTPTKKTKKDVHGS